MCVVDATGKVVRQVKVASELETLVGYFDMLGWPIARIGLEAGPLSQCLHAAVVAVGREFILLGDTACEGSAIGDDDKIDRTDA